MEDKKSSAISFLAAGITASLLWCSAGCKTFSQPSGAATDYSATSLAPSVARIQLRGNDQGLAERGLDLTLLRASEAAMERGYSHFTIIDEEASGTGQLVYRPGLTQADYKPERGLVVKFFSARPKGMFSFDARTLQRIMSAKLNLNQ